MRAALDRREAIPDSIPVGWQRPQGPVKPITFRSGSRRLYWRSRRLRSVSSIAGRGGGVDARDVADQSAALAGRASDLTGLAFLEVETREPPTVCRSAPL
jgi:hypothetical protein